MSLHEFIPSYAPDLGGAVCGDGDTEEEIRRRIQAGASAWRKVEGLMGDRHIETMAIT